VHERAFKLRVLAEVSRVGVLGNVAPECVGGWDRSGTSCLEKLLTVADSLLSVVRITQGIYYSDIPHDREFDVGNSSF
jgi:hypothetical protein